MNDLHLIPKRQNASEDGPSLALRAYSVIDYDDLMSGVDAVLLKSYVDDKNLFVSGGSGGGVLSAWIIGKTNRFRAPRANV